jgi:hypothetical protein
VAKITEAERLEYNRDCDELEALRVAYRDFERRFDEKWNPELVKGRAAALEASGLAEPNPMYAHFQKSRQK